MIPRLYSRTQTAYKTGNIVSRINHGRTHGAPYRSQGYIPQRFGEGTSLREQVEYITLANHDFSRPQSSLDYQVSICSLIPPATAISKTQDSVDTSVWWKLPFSIFFIIYHVQSAIINKVCKPELWFLCSTHPIIMLYICMKFHENISNNF